MNKSMMLLFIKIIRSKPELVNDRKAFVKFVTKQNEELFNINKKVLRERMNQDKNRLIEMFDIYKKFRSEHDIVTTDSEELVETLYQAFEKQDANDEDRKD